MFIEGTDWEMGRSGGGIEIACFVEEGGRTEEEGLNLVGRRRRGDAMVGIICGMRKSGEINGRETKNR